VRVLDEIVGALRTGGIAGEPIGLTQRGEELSPARDHLVHIGLVPGVPDERIVRGAEDPVQRQGQFDDAEIGAQMAAGRTDTGDQLLPDLSGQDRQCAGRQPAYVVG